MFTDAVSLKSERLIAGPSAIVGITALTGQIGVLINPVGGTMAISNESAGASFWAGYARINGALRNAYPMRGTFYFSGEGATVTVDVTRFFR
jgi:hypothetical protein